VEPVTYSPTDLVNALRHWAEADPTRVAYRFLVDGEDEELVVTYGALDRQARAIGAELLRGASVGDRVLLIYPPGLEFIAGYFGCLYAGLIAVPTNMPRANKPTPRLEAVVRDARPTVVLTTSRVLRDRARHARHAPYLDQLQWLAGNDFPLDDAHDWRPPDISPDTIAMLQYTSGSIGAPKGVIVSHGNLSHNLALIRRAFKIHAGSKGVFWLPSFHDMGLIGGILEPTWSGIESVLMAPASFLLKPVRWLRAISRHGGTICGAPNFGYDLCVRRSSAEQRATLDLSCLELAFCGAEPIRDETLRDFARTFRECNFNEAAFYPCYGLAEATLLVSGGVGPEPRKRVTVSKAALEQDRVVPVPVDDSDAKTIVGCGVSLYDQDIAIVDPVSLQRCGADEIGEVWISSGSVARGYWNRPDETLQTFGAYLSDSGDGPYLRTGDLGFFHAENLFITGRIKDMIIIRGRNVYPQDVEALVERSHPALRRGFGAAFAVEGGASGSEGLVVVNEIERRYRNSVDAEEVIIAIRTAIAAGVELQPSAIVLARPNSIPMTSSGKVRRRQCRRDYLDGKLNVIHKWNAEEKN
ncbi:MAG: fatty acyl-AMP ligase, partial [Anaerolineales bacterium]